MHELHKWSVFSAYYFEGASLLLYVLSILSVGIGKAPFETGNCNFFGKNLIGQIDKSK